LHCIPPARRKGVFSFQEIALTPYPLLLFYFRAIAAHRPFPLLASPIYIENDKCATTKSHSAEAQKHMLLSQPFKGGIAVPTANRHVANQRPRCSRTTGETMQRRKKTGAWLVLYMLLAGAMTHGMSEAATPAQIDAARNGGLAWLYGHQQGEGGWDAPFGAQAIAGHSALEAFNKAGVRGYPYYAALSWLDNLKTDSIDSVSRQVLGEAAAGGNALPYFSRLYSFKNDATRSTWGAYRQFSTSIVDTALALRAIRAGQFTAAANYPNYVSELRTAVFCNILPAQNSDGGWGQGLQVSGGVPNVTRSGLLPTVLMVLELNAGKATTGDTGSCSATYSIATVTTNALNWLLT